MAPSKRKKKKNDNSPQVEVVVKEKKPKLDYKVEAIRGKRITDEGYLEYFVKWVGYPEEENTWEPVEHCLDAFEMVLEWERSPTGVAWTPAKGAPADKLAAIHRDIAYRADQRHMRTGGYEIVELLGIANHNKWVRLKRKPNYPFVDDDLVMEERILMMIPDDYYLSRIGGKEQDILKI